MSETYTSANARRIARIGFRNGSYGRPFYVESTVTTVKRTGVRVTRTTSKFFTRRRDARAYAEEVVGA